MALKKNKKFKYFLDQAGLSPEEFENLSDDEAQIQLGSIVRKLAIHLYQTRLREKNITQDEIKLFNEEIKSLKKGETVTIQTLGLVAQELNIKLSIVRYENGKKISKNPEPIPQIGLSPNPHQVTIKHEGNHFTLLSPIEKPNVIGAGLNCGFHCLILACKETVKQENKSKKIQKIEEIKIEKSTPITVPLITPPKKIDPNPVKETPHRFKREINELANVLLDEIDEKVRKKILSRDEGEKQADKLLNDMFEFNSKNQIKENSQYLFFAENTRKTVAGNIEQTILHRQNTIKI